jgi:hypothetical protein
VEQRRKSKTIFGGAQVMNKIFGKYDTREYTNEQKHALAVCGILMCINLGADGILKFPVSNKVSVKEEKAVLAEMWGISNHDQAIEAMAYLSKGDGQGPVANEIYSEIISTGRKDPVYAAVFDPANRFKKTWLSAYARAQEALTEFMFENQIPQEEEDVCLNILADMFFTDRVNGGMTGYQVAITYLAELGFSERELLGVRHFSAWDYGRCGMIGRFGVYVGYLTEEEAWGYMLTASENAKKEYASWREFLTAYFLGRSIAFGADDLDNFEEIIGYLLYGIDSPYFEIPFGK